MIEVVVYGKEKKVMRIGIYLAYGPIPGLSLKQEGLGRYLSELMRALVKNGDEIVIACPSWTVNAIEELIEEFRIPNKDIEFVISKSQPIIYRIYEKWKLRLPKHKKVKKVSFKIVDSIFLYMISAKNYLQFFIMLILAFMLFVLLLPVLVAIVLLYIIYKILAKIVSKFIGNYTDSKYLTDKIKNLVKRNQALYDFFRHAKKQYSPSGIQKILREDAANILIEAIGKMKTPVDIWYCPMAFWPEFNNIREKKVVCMPDLLTEEFASSFSINDVAASTAEVRKTTINGEYFITYCNYIKDKVLVDKYNKKDKNVCVIPHAINETLPYIEVSSCFSHIRMKKDELITKYARNMLYEIIPNCPEMKEYLGEYEGVLSMRDVKYIFYSAQARPSKNIINLVKAYEELLRNRNRNMKLFLTCNLEHYRPLKEYIYEHNLKYDVLCFKSVTNQQLAALYRCAELIVTPTMYEGGFPFTFGEGMSVGTPSVMGNIPQVREVLNGADWEDVLFDPYDYMDMADKIEYALDHKECIYAKEKVIFEQMQKRSWEQVGIEYVQAFHYFLHYNESC